MREAGSSEGLESMLVCPVPLQPRLRSQHTPLLERLCCPCPFPLRDPDPPDQGMLGHRGPGLKTVPLGSQRVPEVSCCLRNSLEEEGSQQRWPPPVTRSHLSSSWHPSLFFPMCCWFPRTMEVTSTSSHLVGGWMEQG